MCCLAQVSHAVESAYLHLWVSLFSQSRQFQSHIIVLVHHLQGTGLMRKRETLIHLWIKCKEAFFFIFGHWMYPLLGSTKAKRIRHALINLLRSKKKDIVEEIKRGQDTLNMTRHPLIFQHRKLFLYSSVFGIFI